MAIRNKKKKPAPPKAPIDLWNLPEVITSLVTLYSTSPVNFDAIYSYLCFYVASVDQATLEGLSAAIREGAYWGREYDSEEVFPTDTFH